MCRYGFSLLICLLCVYPVLFSEIPGSVVWCLVLILKMLCPLLLQIISSIPYCLSSSGIPNTYILILRMCQVLGVSVLFFFFLCFAFKFGRFIDLSLSSLNSPQIVSILMRALKIFFICVTMLFISGIYF